MNTQSHLIINAAILTKKNDSNRLFLMVLLGSLIPDLPMFVFVYVESIIKKYSGIILWNERYYDASWQLFFNIFNSIPITLVIIIIGVIIYKKNYISHKILKNTQSPLQINGSRVLLAFGLALILHEITDLFLHYDDGHAHFLPFSNFVLQSPFSYWDIRHHAYAVSIIISLIELVAFAILFFRAKKRGWKIFIVVICIVNITLEVLMYTSMDSFIHY